MVVSLSGGIFESRPEVALRLRTTDPSGISAIYTKDISGNPEFFFWDESNVVKLTVGGKINAIAVTGQATGDLLQFAGLDWQPRGTSGDPVQGDVYLSNIVSTSILSQTVTATDLQVTNDTDIDGILTVGGSATFANPVSVNTLAASADVQTKKLTIESTDNDITVQEIPGGGATPNRIDFDNPNSGGAEWNFKINSKISLNINENSVDPGDQDDTLNLGSSAFRWQKVFVSDEVIVGSGSTKLLPERIRLHTNSGDPGSLSTGDFWFDGNYFRGYDGLTSFDLWQSNRSLLGDITGIPSAITVEGIRGKPVEASADSKYILQVSSDGTSFDAVGHNSGDPVLGTLYVEDLTIVGSSKNLLWDTDKGGNIGASGANRPNIIYADQVIAGTGMCKLLTDRVNLYDNAASPPGSLQEGDLWYDDVGLNYYDGSATKPAMGFGVNNFTVLSNSATASEINTALSNYDIVYLETGANDLGNNNLSIPAQKTLIGLGGVYQGTGGGTDLTIQVDSTHRVQMASSSRLENLKLRFASTSTAGNEMIETSTNDGVVIRGVNVDGSAVASGAGIVSWAIMGAVKEVTHCYFVKCAGINIDTTTQREGGKTEIGYINWEAHSSDISAQMVAVSVSSAGGPVWIHDVHGRSGYGVLNIAAPDTFAERIFCTNSEVYGVNWSGTGTEGILSSVVVDGGRWGCRIEAPRMIVSNFYARDMTDRGFWSSGQNDSTLSNIHTYACGGTTNAGIYINGAARVTISNLTDYSGGSYGAHLRQISLSTISGVVSSNGGSSGVGHHGIFLETCTKNTFTGLTSYLTGYGSGIYLTACTFNTLSGVNAYDNAVAGITLATSDNNAITGFTATANTTDGVVVGAGSDYNIITGGQADDNGSDGIFCDANDGNYFGQILTRDNGAYGVNGANSAGTANNTLHGHTSHSDTSGATSLGTGWNSADLW